jgi:hypothetical protein
VAAISGERKTCSRPVKSSLEVLLESRRSWGCPYSTVTVYTHLRLVDKVPNFQRYETARLVATLDGTELPYLPMTWSGCKAASPRQKDRHHPTTSRASQRVG